MKVVYASVALAVVAFFGWKQWKRAGPLPARPAGCSLTGAALEARQGEIAQLLAASKERSAVPGGVRLALSSNALNLATLAAFVANESQCCSFLSFNIDLPAHSEVVYFRVTGQDEAEVRALFALTDARN